ncbi:MAG TPA: hypothetical protein VFQ35_14490 [Polyangiaceae bacterium]|nr:hypothetical protein [Polyangiaceae bacterium]
MQAGKEATSNQRVLVERPPEGLLRGKAEGPRWLFVVITLAALALLVAFYARKLRRKFRS